MSSLAAKRRNLDGNYVQAVVKIGSKLALTDRILSFGGGRITLIT